MFHRSALGGCQASSSIPKLMSCPTFDFSSHLRHQQARFCPQKKRIPTKGMMADISHISVLAASPLLFPHACNRSNFHFVVANTWQRVKGVGPDHLPGFQPPLLLRLSCHLFSIPDAGMSPLFLPPCQEIISSHPLVSPCKHLHKFFSSKHFFQVFITYFIKKHF